MIHFVLSAALVVTVPCAPADRLAVEASPRPPAAQARSGFEDGSRAVAARGRAPAGPARTQRVGGVAVIAAGRNDPPSPAHVLGRAREGIRLRAEDPDSAAVLAAVQRVFDGMAEADSGKVRAQFHEGTRLVGVTVRDGRREVSYLGLDGWLRAIAGSDRRWLERIYDVTVQVDGDMASVWAPYTFYLDGQVRHCGVNSIELVRTDEGWKITQITDTRRREGCPER